MEKAATLNLRVNSTVKEMAEEILSRLGVPMSTAINMYLNQIILTGGIPFHIGLPKAPDSVNADLMSKVGNIPEKDRKIAMAYSLQGVFGSKQGLFHDICIRSGLRNGADIVKSSVEAIHENIKTSEKTNNYIDVISAELDDMLSED